VEFAGGIMIMGLLLGLLCVAVFISIPVLVLTLGKRISELNQATASLSVRIAGLEEQINRLAAGGKSICTENHDEDMVSGQKYNSQNPEE
jgi:hypothetical protein